jgi:hypothetical protein
MQQFETETKQCCKLSFRWFPRVWNLCADVSEHSVPPLEQEELEVWNQEEAKEIQPCTMLQDKIKNL